MRDGAERALALTHLDRHDRGAGRHQRDLPVVEPSDGSTVQLSQQVGHVRGDEIDQRG
jgi:hypothetical protein